MRVIAAGVIALLAIPLPVATAAQAEHIRTRAYVLDFDPIMDSGLPLTVDRAWGDPIAMDDEYRSDVVVASGGVAEQRIARTSIVRNYPVKPGGFTFTNADYLICLAGSPPPDYCNALIDYAAVLGTAYDPRFGSACEALRKGRIDEVWLWGGPWFGYQEYLVVDPNTLCPQVSRTFVVMGFSYERGVSEMLHNLGHRAEALVQTGIGFELWDRFDGQRARYSQDFACPAAPDASHPEVDPLATHAGNVHLPPNAYCHYQYDRDYPVVSDADDWAHFPNLTGRQTAINSSTWGGTQRGYMIWWLGRFPRNLGSTDGVQHDWWRYVFPAGRARPPA
jgi:hypothetical protein